MASTFAKVVNIHKIFLCPRRSLFPKHNARNPGARTNAPALHPAGGQKMNRSYQVTSKERPAASITALFLVGAGMMLVLPSLYSVSEDIWLRGLGDWQLVNV